MGYLRCEKCGGYYELQEGESPEDFEECECGGKLIPVDSIPKESSKKPKEIFCSNCETGNPDNAVFCQECGADLKNSKLKKGFLESLNYKAILIGTLVSIILGVAGFLVGSGAIILTFVGSVLCGFLAGGSYKRGALHGGMTFLVFAIALIGFFINLLIIGDSSFNFAGKSIMQFLIIIILILVSLFIMGIGAFFGVIGIWISRNIRKNKPKQKIIEDTEIKHETDKGWWGKKNSNEKWKIGYISLIAIIFCIIVVTGANIGLNSQKDIGSNLSQNTTTTPSNTNSNIQSTDSSSKSKFPITLPEGMKVSCPNCGSFNNVVTDETPSNGKYLDYFKCNNCGNTWSETFPTSALG